MLQYKSNTLFRKINIILQVLGKKSHDFKLYFQIHTYRQRLIIQGNGEGEVTDNPKPLVKQKQSKHGTKWI
jgi:hypothetical protein